MTLSQAKSLLSDKWQGLKGETYELRLHNDNYWLAVRHDSTGEQKGFRLRWDHENSCVWWGQSYFLDPADFEEKPNSALWYAFGDTSKVRARFTWKRCVPLGSVPPK